MHHSQITCIHHQGLNGEFADFCDCFQKAKSDGRQTNAHILI